MPAGPAAAGRVQAGPERPEPARLRALAAGRGPGLAPDLQGIRVRRHRLGENTSVARYKPRHTSHEVAGPGRRRPRRSVVVGGAVAGAVIVVAAVAVPLMTSGGGGGGGPAKTTQAAAATTATTGGGGSGRAVTTVATAGTSASTGAGNGVYTRGAGSAGLTTTSVAPAPTTSTTTRPHVNPAAKTSPAINVAAPAGLGEVMEALWAGPPGRRRYKRRRRGVHSVRLRLLRRATGHRHLLGYSPLRPVEPSPGRKRYGGRGHLAGPIQHHSHLRQSPGPGLGVPGRVHNDGVRSSRTQPRPRLMGNVLAAQPLRQDDQVVSVHDLLRDVGRQLRSA